jgi:hypothetical protein
VVAGIARFITRRLLEVIEDTVAAEVNLGAALSEAEAEVDVLVPIQEGFVEPADRFKSVSTDERAGRSDHLKRTRLADSWVVCREPCVDVPRDAFLRDDDSCVLNRVVGIEQFAPDDRYMGCFVSVGDERVEPTGLGLRVVVQEDEVLAASDLRSRVAGLRKPRGGFVGDDANQVVARREDIGGVVTRRVVDDDYLEFGHLCRPSEQPIEQLARKR